MRKNKYLVLFIVLIGAIASTYTACAKFHTLEVNQEFASKNGSLVDDSNQSPNAGNSDSSSNDNIPTAVLNPAILPLVKFVSIPAIEGTMATIEIELSAPGNETVSFKIKTAGGTATAGSDYLPVDKVVTLPKGITKTTISLETYADSESEGDEKVIFDLSNFINAKSEISSFETIIKNSAVMLYDVPQFKTNVKMVEGSGWGTCLVTKDNSLYFSYTDGYKAFSKITIPDNSSIVQLKGSHGCAVILENGKSYYGQGGTAKPMNFSRPAKKLSLGYSAFCGMLDNGSVECIMDHLSGKIEKVNKLNGEVVDIASFDYETCVLIKGKGVECYREIQIGNYPPVKTFPNVPDKAKILSGGFRYFCYSADEIVKCFPDYSKPDATVSGIEKNFLFPDKGSLSLQTTNGLSGARWEGAPVFARTCVVSNGGLKCWDVTPSAYEVPGFKSGIQSLSHGFFHMCLVTENGTLKCFGNKNGLQ